MANDDVLYQKSAGRPSIARPDSRTLMAMYKVCTRKQLAAEYGASMTTIGKWISEARKELQGNLKA